MSLARPLDLQKFGNDGHLSREQINDQLIAIEHSLSEDIQIIDIRMPEIQLYLSDLKTQLQQLRSMIANEEDPAKRADLYKIMNNSLELSATFERIYLNALDVKYKYKQGFINSIHKKVKLLEIDLEIETRQIQLPEAEESMRRNLANEEILCTTDVKHILEKYKELLPKTIYHDNWIDIVGLPNKIFLSNISKYCNKDNPNVAEIGIGYGATTFLLANLLKNYNGTVHIFDFHDSVNCVSKILKLEGLTNIIKYGCSDKIQDSYNWSLLNLIEKNKKDFFDYVFLDGAHTFPTDALTFFLADMLLKVGGHIEFDDYDWTLNAHIQSNIENYKNTKNKDGYHGSFIDRIKTSFTEEQIKMRQVALIVDNLVKKCGRYSEILPNRLYQKVS